MTHEEKQIHNAVHAELREFEEFKELVKRMREAQMECAVVDMMVRTKKKEDISDELMAEFAAAMCNVVFYEDKVDEYLQEQAGSSREE